MLEFKCFNLINFFNLYFIYFVFIFVYILFFVIFNINKFTIIYFNVFIKVNYKSDNIFGPHEKEIIINNYDTPFNCY